MNNLFDLSNKLALVTGCNRGIGKSIAIGLAKAGANIIGVSSSITKDSQIQKEIESFVTFKYCYSCTRYKNYKKNSLTIIRSYRYIVIAFKCLG